LSLTALRYSGETLRVRTDPFGATITRRGFNPLRDYIPIAQHDGYYVLFRQRAEQNARRLVSQPGQTTFAFDRRNSAANEALRRIIELCGREHIELHLVIYPYHAQMQLLFYESNLWPAYEGWKRYLATAVRSSASVGTRVTLWDFSGFDAYSTEAIPPRGDTRTQLAYYWEAGHFKSTLGDLVLDRVLDYGSSTPPSFGVVLTPETVNQRANDERNGLMRYRTEHPRVADEARDIVDAQCRAFSNAMPARCPARSTAGRRAGAPSA
jgi:hypothetical protein